jgi:hypothetical protein
MDNLLEFVRGAIAGGGKVKIIEEFVLVGTDEFVLEVVVVVVDAEVLLLF